MVPFVLFFLATASSFRLSPTVLSTTACGKYECAPSNFTFVQGTCAQVVNGTTYVQGCEPFNTTFCNTTSLKCQTLQVPAPQLSWPGELCTTSSNCLYGTCQLGKCKSLGQGFPCATSDQCDPGLYCNSTGICATQLAVGATGCKSEYDCWNGAECNTTASGVGVCVQFATVAQLGGVSDCVGGFSRMCKTGACRSLDSFTKFGHCIDPPISTTSLPVKCTADSDCVASDGFNYYLSTCPCGFNSAGTKYCQPFLGDPPGISYVTTWAAMLRDSGQICNTMRRYTEACMDLLGIKAKVLQATYNYQYYPLIQGNDDCVKKTYTRAYWAGARTVVVGVLLGVVLS